MSMMKMTVLVGFMLFALVPLIDAACGLQPLFGQTHCQDSLDKSWHPIGAFWVNSKCERCNCYKDGMRCCERLPARVSHPDDCTVEYDYDLCTYKIIKRSDPTIPCTLGVIGK